MNRRDLFKSLAVAPAAILPAAEKPKEPATTTLALPALMRPGESITVIAMDKNKWAVLR